MANARLRPRIEPSLPPVIISVAITSVYSVIAVWTPVTSVPTSLATVAIATFITDVSSVIRNWPAARVIRTIEAPDVSGLLKGGLARVHGETVSAGRGSPPHPAG